MKSLPPLKSGHTTYQAWSKRSSKFTEVVSEIPKHARKVCLFKGKQAIDRAFIRAVVPTANFVILREDHAKPSNPKTSPTSVVTGFAVGYIKRIAGVSCMYIDLICAVPRKGRELHRAALEYAHRRGCKFTALRASESKLIRTYRNWGYERRINACKKDSRSQRAQRRKVDANAVYFRGDIREDGKREREGWSPYDGWWMSRCLTARDADAGVRWHS